MKKVLVNSVILIVGLGSASISLNTTQGQESTSTQESKTDEPTVIKVGQFTEKEKAYSKYYRQIYGFYRIIHGERDRKKLTEVDQPGGLGISIGVGMEPFSPNQPEKSDIEFFTEMSCQADAIIIGQVKDRRSHLTDDERFIFTSYDLQIKRIVKDNQNKPLEDNKVIEVTRPGGFIKIKEQQIKLDDESFTPLENSKVYLLFLKYIPQADGYVVANARSDFKISDNDEYESISRMKRPNILKEGTSTDILVSKIQSSFVSDCSQYLSGGTL